MDRPGQEEPPTEIAVRRLRRQAVACRELGSPLYTALLGHAADDLLAGGPAAGVLDGHLASLWPSALGLRMLGGVHALVLTGQAPELAAFYPSAGGTADPGPGYARAWAATRQVLADRRDAVCAWLDRPPQTNEVGRSASLVGGFLVVARDTGLPLRVLEVGSSAGLNLRFDRYWYETDGAGYGDAGSPVRFTDLWEDGRPPFDAPVQVAERRGCDRDPIDAGTEDGRLTLLSYVWPGQTQRFTMLRAALDVAADAPVAIDRADIPAWLAERLDEPAPGRATVVFHSITWQYLTDGERATAEAALVTAGARATHDAPLAWLRLEPSADLTHAELRLTTWPAGEERLLAHCHYHLGPMRWVA